MQKQIVWNLLDLAKIDGNRTSIHGNPGIVETPSGPAMAFDGIQDAIFLDVLPFQGWQQFTIEALFMPHAGGPAEQRFIHMQETGTQNRVMFETRLTSQPSWYADTFIACGNSSLVLIDPANSHPTGEWYSLALTCDGQTAAHYVNGNLELTGKVDFQPLNAGSISVGVRQNMVCWFKGLIQTIRFSPRVLAPAEMLLPGSRLSSRP